MYVDKYRSRKNLYIEAFISFKIFRKLQIFSTYMKHWGKVARKLAAIEPMQTFIYLVGLGS